MKEKGYRIIGGGTVLLLLVSVAVLYVTHRVIPFMMDDLWYATMLSTEEPISSLGDIIESQIWHYHNWGGRSITHGILQLTLLAGEQAADILNILVTFVLAGMICMVAECRNVEKESSRESGRRLSGYRWQSGCYRLAWLLAAVGMLLGLNANWKMSMFWQAGAANYLYITIFILLYLYCYLRELPQKCALDIDVAHGKGMHPEQLSSRTIKQLPGIVLWMIPLGLVAGWSNENMGPAVWVVSLLVMILLKKEKQRLRLWMVLGNASCLLGSILVVAAPGNFVRSSQVAENEYGLLWNLFLRCYGESKAAAEYLFPTLLVLVGVLVIGKGVLGLAIGRQNCLLMLGAFLSWGAMVLSPHYPDRAAFGTMVLMICVILSMTGKILKERKDLTLPFWGIAVLIWLRGMFYLGEYLAINWGWIR